MYSNINSRAIVEGCRIGKHRQEHDHIYTMSFVASPWDFPTTFHRIPQLSLRVAVDPISWEVTDLDARLVFGRKYTDLMIPSMYGLSHLSLTISIGGATYDYCEKTIYRSLPLIL